MEEVTLYIINIELGIKHKDYLFETVKEEQRKKALFYKNELDQVRSLLSSFLLNRLSKENIKKGETGKPYLENGPYFNISHADQYVVMAVSKKEIGIDIEGIKEKDMTILSRIFNEAEAKMLKDHADFYFLWCAKESLIKCMGSSINKIKEVPSLPLNGLKTYKSKDYQVKTFIYDKHVISITRESNIDFLIKKEIVKSLSR